MQLFQGLSFYLSGSYLHCQELVDIMSAKCYVSSYLMPVPVIRLVCAAGCTLYVRSVWETSTPLIGVHRLTLVFAALLYYKVVQI